MIVFKEKISLREDNKKLCQFLDSAFDTSLIIDVHCNIINFGKGARQLNAGILSNYLDKNISEIDENEPYKKVIETGVFLRGRFATIARMPVIQNIYPISIGGQIAGALSISTYYNLSLIEQQLLESDHASAARQQHIIQECTRNYHDSNPFQLSLKELIHGDPVIEPLINTIFDSAIYVDTQNKILRCNMGQLKLTDEQARDMTGQTIDTFHSKAPFAAVANTGKAIVNYLSIVFGRLSINCIYPIFDPSTGKLIALLGTIQYSNINNLRLFFQTNAASTDSLTAVTARLKKNYTFQDFLGTSPATVKLLEMCKKIAVTEFPALITGESGTGKEVIAGAIHTANQKHSINPYVRLNCSAIPHDLMESELFGYKKGAFTGAAKDKAGYFEIAAHGTLLLDEIGDMDIRLQSKLLRVLESRVFSRLGDTKEIPLNARIVASTNRDLYKMSMEGTFRLDLYYRLNTIEIKIPPLRERREDIPLLVSHFLLSNEENIGILPDAMNLLHNYDWPGNVRELRNIINRICILYSGKSVSADDIRPFLHNDFQVTEPLPPKNMTDARSAIISEICTLEEGEIALIKAALKEEHYNISNTAKILGITRATLYNKLKKYQIPYT
ncbi:MAG: sigma 54-interacting transcriptional regulator [Eubacterium sp.]|nr:sigma 54-interacting transcriptional regulator [Eubacterium sp.]